jgi:hypothetical protein
MHHTRTPAGPLRLPFFALYFVMIVLHEVGHAFTVKLFGYEVPRVGVGWYLFGPIAYTDTSDMWLADRRPRLLVTLGGPYASAVVAGDASIGAVLTTGSIEPAALWQLAVMSYYVVLMNLNSLLGLDGYFLLMDWLDHPDLYAHCLTWLGTKLPSAIHHRAELGGTSWSSSTAPALRCTWSSSQSSCWSSTAITSRAGSRTSCRFSPHPSLPER